MKTEAWIAWKLLFSRSTIFGGSAPLSLLGLILGVASLVASMAVISGFEGSLRDAMSDVTGHVQVIKRSRIPDDSHELEERIRGFTPELQSAVAFIRVEALLAHQGRIHGVMLQGIDETKLEQTLRLQSRLQEGTLSLEQHGEFPPALIGIGLATKFNLKPGDKFRVVLPIPDTLHPEQFRRKLGEFTVAGVLDLGKHEWNERFIMAPLKAVQDVAEVGDRFLGLLLRYPDPERARPAGFELSQNLGSNYWVSDWHELNENLFEAIRLERPTIFFVVFIIIIVAAFNICITLYVFVVRRYEELAILKTVGVRSSSILRIFGWQGAFFGLTGVILGFAVGLLLCLGFLYLQSRYQVMPPEVYKLQNIRLVLRWQDLAAIAGTTLGICLLASIFPALRGARLTPVEGLRHV